MNEYPELEPGEDRPASVHAEMTILGAMLVEPSAIRDAMAYLTTNDFSLDSHRKIYSAMMHLVEEQTPVDIVTLNTFFQRKKQLDAIGGLPYLASLTEGLPRKLNVESYVKIVRDKSLMRQMMEVCDMGLLEGSDQSKEAMEVINDVTKRLTAIVQEGNTTYEVIGPVEMAREAEDRLIDNPPDSTAISTGIQELDDFTGGGIRLGETWVIGASPSRGKTTLARQIAKNMVWRDTAAYVHSGEMSKESWFDVTACLLEGVPAWKIREPKMMSLVDKERLRDGIRALGKMPLFISDTASIHIDELIWNASEEIRLHDMKVGFYDYAQIIQAAGDDKTKVTTVSRRVVQFHKDTNTCGIILSQSPRPEGKNINARPTMHSLKESGALEEGATVVILPYRPVDLETGKWTGEDELIIGKNRWGQLGHIKVHLNGQYLRFDPRD